MAIFTLGHSTHDPKTFKGILTEARLDGIVDVRSHRSSKWRWWHAPDCQQWLNRGGFRYYWFPTLGGWNTDHAGLMDWATPRGVKLGAYVKGHFPKQRIGADADQAYDHRPEWESKWTSQGLHDYAWFTALPEFQQGCRELIKLCEDLNLAIVCSEAMWWKCHRSMVADVLTHAYGAPVSHVMPSGRRVRITAHDPAPRIDRYPLEVVQSWGAPRTPTD